MGSNLFVCHFFVLVMRIANTLQVTPCSTLRTGFGCSRIAYQFGPTKRWAAKDEIRLPFLAAHFFADLSCFGSYSPFHNLAALSSGALRQKSSVKMQAQTSSLRMNGDDLKP